jgi:hypothetical protein
MTQLNQDTNPRFIYVQNPFSFGVQFGMGLIIAPIVLGLLLGAVAFVIGFIGNAASEWKTVNFPKPSASRSTQTVEEPESIVTPEPVAVTAAVPRKPWNIPWAAILFGGTALMVVGGGGYYVYWLMNKQECDE